MRSQRLFLLASVAWALQQAVSLTPFLSGRLFTTERHSQKFPLGMTAAKMPVEDDGSVSDAHEKWRLKAYENWRKEYGKGAFDPDRYKNFKANYIGLMHANAAALEEARRQGKPEPEPQTLNEYGDYSAEEYEAVIAGGAQNAVVSSGNQVS